MFNPYQIPTTLPPEALKEILSGKPDEYPDDWLYRKAVILTAYMPQDDRVFDLLEKVERGRLSYGYCRAVMDARKYGGRPGQHLRPPHLIPPWPTSILPDAESKLSLTCGVAYQILKRFSPARREKGEWGPDQVLDVLCPGNPWLMFGATGDMKAATRDKLYGQISRHSAMAPSPVEFCREELSYVAGPREYLIVRPTKGSLEKKAAVLLHLSKLAPMVMVVQGWADSVPEGGRAAKETAILEGWFVAAYQSDAQLMPFVNYAIAMGADHNAFDPLWPACMPGGTDLKGRPLQVIHFNPYLFRCREPANPNTKARN